MFSKQETIPKKDALDDLKVEFPSLKLENGVPGMKFHNESHCFWNIQKKNKKDSDKNTSQNLSIFRSLESLPFLVKTW